MGKNNFQALQYARAQLGRPYWYGTFGQIGDQKLLDEKRKQYPSQYPPQKWTEESFTSQIGQKVHDCIGLAVKGYLMSENPEAPAKYIAKYDVSANGMIELCQIQGDISSMPDVPGVLVWKPGHIGIYEGKKGSKKVVIEDKGHSFGVVRTTNTPWQKWGLCPWWSYITIKSWVTSLYSDVLGRSPDKGGLEWWCDQLNDGAQTPTQVIKYFLTSPEFKNRNLSNAAFLAVLYQVFFDRAPDRDGYAYWMSQLESGKTREYVINGFLGSQEWKDMSAYLEYII